MSTSKPRNDPERHLANTSEITRQCRARSKATGEQCKNSAIPGATVCRYHGGGAPQVQRRAAMRLASLVEPALVTVARIMLDPTARDADRLRAAENVLDRSGVSRKAEVITNDTARDILRARLEALRQNRDGSVTLSTHPDNDPDPDDLDDEEFDVVESAAVDTDQATVPAADHAPDDEETSR